MIRFIHLADDGRTFYTFGLTDVNLKRLRDGMPIRTSLNPGTSDKGVVLVYHATRESLIELADTLGVEQHLLLDQLGEG